MHHGGHRALAVGAGDVNGGERALRVAESLAEAGDVVEAELDAQRLEREEAVEHLSVRVLRPLRSGRSHRWVARIPLAHARARRA